MDAMKEENWGYSKSIKEFNSETNASIYSAIDHSVDNSSRIGTQKMAWDKEIDILKQAKLPDEGQILFEYTIPRIGLRADVILLLRGIVFVLEFKVGEGRYNSADRKQTKGYAEALKYYHSKSRNRVIVPLLVATNAPTRRTQLHCDSIKRVYNTIVCNGSNITENINRIFADNPGAKGDEGWEQNWILGRYNPNPTIIDGMLMRYHNHNVNDIRASEASANELGTTTRYLIDKIKETKRNKERAIFFVTGVPGAGKTLVGLDVVAETQKDYHSIFLSGNGPLVDVLTAELTEDGKRFDEDSEGAVCAKPISLIQLIHRYRREIVKKIKAVDSDGTLLLKDASELDRTSEDGVAEVENVAIFDEAQRAWTREHLQKPGRSGRKTVLQDRNFPYSEPAFLIWSMNLRPEWSAIICLVGGGQEINDGEAGILEWLKAVRDQFPRWRVYISPNLHGKEYAGDDLKDVLASLSHVTTDCRLHLSTSKRSLRAENVSAFVKCLLDRDPESARLIYNEFKDRFPIKLTRCVKSAKTWLARNRDSASKDEPPHRAGLLMSSKAFRMRPLGYEIKLVGVYNKVAKWFLCDKKNAESSDSFEVALSEFFVQGLELDWVGVLWDADFRPSLTGGEWEFYGGFNGIKWAKNLNAIAQNFQLNAYRVLLTRARRGMIIVVPEGDANDPSRSPEIYDRICAYLLSCGIEPWDEDAEQKSADTDII